MPQAAPRDVLRYSGEPAIRAATSPTTGKETAVLTAAPPGPRCEIALPASNAEVARRMVSDLSRRWNDAAESPAGKALMWIPKSSVAGELYPQLVEAHRATFIRALEDVAADYAKEGKYTPEHAKKIVAAKKALARNLDGVVPGLTGLNIRKVPPSSTAEVAGELARQVQALEGMEGRPARNLARNIIKRAGVDTIADDVAIQTNLKLAQKLQRVNTFVQVVEFIPPAAVALTTDDDRERERALVQLVGKGYGMVAEKAVTLGGPALCVAFGVGTMGWGFAACGLASLAAGIYLGNEVESQMTKALTPTDATP